MCNTIYFDFDIITVVWCSMNKIIIDRKSKEVKKIRENILLIFLYNTVVGRCFLKITTRPRISRLSGKYFDSKLSKPIIRRFVLKNEINMDEYIQKDYESFNDFFTRKIKHKSRKIINESKTFISPCDAKLSVYKVSDDLNLKIKRSNYSLNDLLGENVQVSCFNYTYALVFRLGVDDYHRYVFVDDGVMDEYHKINGVLHAVRPIAQKRYPIFFQNQREWTLLHTKNFGDIVEIEVGSLMVGKIINHDIKKFVRGNEKGYFKFGGSTIVLLVNDIEIDEDILENSKNDLETVVKLGEKIGRKKSH